LHSLNLDGKSLGFIGLLVIIRNLGYGLFGLRVRQDRARVLYLDDF